MSTSGSRSLPFALSAPISLRLSRLSCALAACAAVACAAPVQPVERVESPAAVPPPPGGLSDSGWGRMELPSVPASVALPELRYWRARERGTFVELEHAASGSRITLRAWRAPRLVRPRECEAEARLARPDLPSATAETELERARVAYPEGFDAELSVGVEPHEHGARGHATLVAAGTGRCLFVVFESVATGSEAAAHVADRLTIAVAGILPNVRIRSVDARAISGPAD